SGHREASGTWHWRVVATPPRPPALVRLRHSGMQTRYSAIPRWSSTLPIEYACAVRSTHCWRQDFGTSRGCSIRSSSWPTPETLIAPSRSSAMSSTADSFLTRHWPVTRGSMGDGNVRISRPFCRKLNIATAKPTRRSWKREGKVFLEQVKGLFEKRIVIGLLFGRPPSDRSELVS